MTRETERLAESRRAMMHVVRRVLISLGIVVAAVLLWVRRVDSPGLGTAPVVVAQKDMTEGATIDRMGVVVTQWPLGTIPAGAFTSIDSVAGRVTRVSIFKGEALVPGRLAPVGAGPGLDVTLTPGKRAMSFRINDVSGIAGLIQPNSRVDVVVVVDDGRSRGRVAKLFMENMRVLAIGAVPQRSPDGRPINTAIATVEVTPDEGEHLAIATTQGQIQLLLRGYGDPDSARGAQLQFRADDPCHRAPAGRPFVRDLLLRNCVVAKQMRPQPDTSRVEIFRRRR